MLVEIVPPFLVDTNCLGLSSCSLCAESLLLRMLDHIFDMLGVDRIEYSIEVLTIWISILRIDILQILHDLRVTFELRPYRLNATFVVFRHIDRASLRNLEQLLFPNQYSTHEVSIDCGPWWHVELD